MRYNSAHVFCNSLVQYHFSYLSICFISALSNLKAFNGSGSETLGLWRSNPRPQGVQLQDYDKHLGSKDKVTPSGWKFDPMIWWVKEHGIIMSTPELLAHRSLDRVTKKILPDK